jgi:serine/threonine-protein kinase RsbW
VPPTAPAALLKRAIMGEEVTAVRHDVAAHAAAVGLASERLEDFVLAVNELMTNAIRHGGGSAHVTLRLAGGTLICEVADHGPGLADPATASGTVPPSDRPGGRGLWLAHHLSDGVVLATGPDGVTASVTACLPAQPSGVTADAEGVQNQQV